MPPMAVPGHGTRALRILISAARRDCVLTLQALGEFFRATTRKRIVPRYDAAAQIRDLLAIFATVAADAEAFRTALEGAERGKHSFGDGLLIATAARAGCAYLLTEDMQDGARFDGVTILDPFVGRRCRNRSPNYSAERSVSLACG